MSVQYDSKHDSKRDSKHGLKHVEQYVDVAVFAPLAGTFTYLWPDDLGQAIAGIRVQIPFGRSTRFGVIIATASLQEINQRPSIQKPSIQKESTSNKAAQQTQYKTVLDRLDEKPLFNPRRQQWLQRVGRYYLAQPGELWNNALAWAAQHDIRRFRCLEPERLQQHAPSLAGLFHNRAAISLKTMLQRCEQNPSMRQKQGMRYQIHQACQKGLIEEVFHAPPWGEPPECTPEFPKSDALMATESQQKAISSIKSSLNKFQSFLLFGCTGSGKTEVYIQAAEAVIAKAGQVLVLVPEIGLTPLWLSRLKRRFARVACWHSTMTGKQRLQVRQHLHDTEILIGTRSTLFLPLPKLSMIVVDEEHDASFKQQEGMAYSARDMAILLAQELNIPIVLGSATPSLESWRQASAGIYQRLDLPQRIASNNPPIASKVIDMRQEHELISQALLTALQLTLSQGDQSILFLNRRGYAPALQCTACGDVPECTACSMRLTLHRRAGQLRCHSCGYRRRVPKTCEACGEVAFLPLGEGTEKLDEWLAEKMPTLRFARFDRDVVTSHARLENILDDFEQGKLDCLIGTQMLVKGHDFPNVTLVGVINADLGVNLPDFRAGERWWQQMIQITGRAGRGQKPGQVILQTRMPEAEWFNRMAESQAQSTMNDELELRRQLSFPPFARWVRIVFAAQKMDRAMQVAMQCAKACQALQDDITITGPMPCPMERIAGKYRIELLLRDTTRKILPWKLESIFTTLPKPRDVRIRIDVDPQDMM